MKEKRKRESALEASLPFRGTCDALNRKVKKKNFIFISVASHIFFSDYSAVFLAYISVSM